VVGDQRRAEFGAAAAAILEEEEDQLAKAIEIGVVDDRAAMSLTMDQTSVGEDRKMRRQRVLRYPDQPRQFAGGNAVRIARDEQAETLQTGRLREGAKGAEIC
jgi:hypothetical protein